MELPVDFTDETKLRNAFAWLSRIGAGPTFPGMPIGPYQELMCAALDFLESKVPADALLPVQVRCYHGLIQIRYMHSWKIISNPKEVYDAADKTFMAKRTR